MSADTGEYFCLFFRLNNKVRHWHWPKRTILQCSKAAEDGRDEEGTA